MAHMVHAAMTGYTMSGSLETSEGGSEFEMMDVSVSVIGLTGIICDAVPKKASKKSSGKNSGKLICGKPPKPQSGSVEGNSGKFGKKTKSGSSTVETANTSTTADSSSTDKSDIGPHADGIPTTAVVTFFRNVSSSQNAIASHIPSTPLAIPTSAFGNTSRYMASWRSIDPVADKDGIVSDMSSFKFSRVMKREVVPSHRLDDSASTVYVPEKVTVNVGLMCASEMLELGVATLLVTGNEMGEVQVNLPIRTLLAGGGNNHGTGGAMQSMSPNKSTGYAKKFRVPSGKSKSEKKGMVCFKSDPSRYYKLDETAALRLLVRAMPREEFLHSRPGRIDTRFDTPQVYHNGRFNVDYQSVVSNLHPDVPLGPEGTVAEITDGRDDEVTMWTDEAAAKSHHHPREICVPTSPENAVEKITPRRKASVQQKSRRHRESPSTRSRRSKKGNRGGSSVAENNKTKISKVETAVSQTATEDVSVAPQDNGSDCTRDCNQMFNCGGLCVMSEDDYEAPQQSFATSTYGDDVTATISHTPLGGPSSSSRKMRRSGGSDNSETTASMTRRRGDSFETGATSTYCSMSGTHSSTFDDEEKTLNTMYDNSTQTFDVSNSTQTFDVSVRGRKTSEREKKKNLKKAREKLRRIAEQMGVKPEDLI